MADHGDWRAAIDSEIFREFLFNDSLRKKEAAQAAAKEKEQSDETALAVVSAFEQLEGEIKKDPLKKAVFKAYQVKFATDSEYTKLVDGLFVSAVMMLDLD